MQIHPRRWIHLKNFILFYRAFGDKSNPPSLPDEDGEIEDTNREKCEINEKEEGRDDDDDFGTCAEEQQSSGETVTDQACCGFEELNLTEMEEDKGESSNEKGEENQDEQKTPHGSKYK